MSRDAFWDQALVVDDEIPEDILDKAHKVMLESDSFSEGAVIGTDPDLTSYDYIHDQGNSRCQFLIDYLDTMDVIPELQDHDRVCQLNLHRLTAGGKLAWHTDFGHSLAISIYLSSPKGGELQVLKNGDPSQSLLLTPRKNRMVVMKCDNHHRVLEVCDGVRDSIQIFVQFCKKDSK